MNLGCLRYTAKGFRVQRCGVGFRAYGYVGGFVVKGFSCSDLCRGLMEPSRAEEFLLQSWSGLSTIWGTFKRDLQGFLKGIYEGSIKGSGFRV